MRQLMNFCSTQPQLLEGVGSRQVRKQFQVDNLFQHPVMEEVHMNLVMHIVMYGGMARS